MKRIILATAASLIASSAFAGQFLYPPSNVNQPVVIVDDGGGTVYDFEVQAAKYNAENRRIEIRGSCRSSCTLALSVKNVCVGKGAILKWHHAFNLKDRSPRPDVTNEMLSQIPRNVRYAVEGHITVDYNPQATLTYRQLIDLGVPDCDAPTQIVRAAPSQVNAGVSYNLPPTSDPVSVDADQQKRDEFDAAYTSALSISTKQHGAPVTAKNCDKRSCEDVAAYYDRKGVYTELHRNTSTGNRSICRLHQEGLVEDTYNCMNWLTGERSAWHWRRDPLY